MDSTTTGSLRSRARLIFDAACAAADPARALARALASHPPGMPREGGRHIVIALGKAAVPMAETFLPALRSGAVTAMVITNDENARPVSGADVHASGHPTPDARGLAAAETVIALLKSAGAADEVHVLLSGGGSALLPSPPPHVGLADKQATNGLLLSHNLPIGEVNLVRQQLSRLKGGGMARLAHPAPVTAYILSDVIGNDLRIIASGPTSEPAGTPAEARAVLERHGLWKLAPASIRNELELKPAKTSSTASARNILIGSNLMSLEAAKIAAEEMGLHARIANAALTGPVKEAAASIIAAARAGGSGSCAVIFGGETTVEIRGPGRGGRNQELALRVALAMQLPEREWVFLSGGTDGRDGPTEAAGGLVDGGTIRRISAMGEDALVLLNQSDSHRALSLAGDLLITGATGTNVADVQIMLLGPCH